MFVSIKNDETSWSKQSLRPRIDAVMGGSMMAKIRPALCAAVLAVFIGFCPVQSSAIEMLRPLCNFPANALGNSNQMDIDYTNHEKWHAYFSFDELFGFPLGGEILIDLADYCGVSDEGKDGWVTIRANTNCGVSASLVDLPISFGLTRRAFPGNTPDTEMSFLNCGNSIASPAAAVEVINGEAEYVIGAFMQTLEVSASCSASFLGLEMRKQDLDEMLAQALIPGRSTAMAASAIAESIMTNDPGKLFPFLQTGMAMRWMTLTDSSYATLIQDIHEYNPLTVANRGDIAVRFQVHEDGEYKVRVWNGIGLASPNWTWGWEESDHYTMATGETRTTYFPVWPTSRYDSFQFWISG